jgi:hypothetical protein
VGNKYRLSNPDALPQIAKAIQDWQNPGSRRSDRYYCENCVVPLPCGAALLQYATTKPLAGILPGNGHVAWAYRIPTVWETEDLFNYPEGEAESGGEWRVGEKVAIGGGRDITITDARIFYQDNQYTAWKGLWSRDGNFEEAFLTALRALETPFGMLIVNNCNQAAHAVLTAFGADLIPSGDDFWKGTYLPGDYFDFIRVPPVYFGPDQPTPTPAPPPGSPGESLRASAMRQRDEPVGTDVVYRLGNRGSLHLTLACQALNAGATEPDEYGVPYTEDLHELAREFDGAICGTCLRLLKIGPRVVRSMPTKTGEMHFCRDRLRIGEPDTGIEILYERITDIHAKWLAFSPTAVVAFRIPLPNGVTAARTADIVFDTKEERDACLGELKVAVYG